MAGGLGWKPWISRNGSRGDQQVSFDAVAEIEGLGNDEGVHQVAVGDQEGNELGKHMMAAALEMRTSYTDQWLANDKNCGVNVALMFQLGGARLGGEAVRWFF